MILSRPLYVLHNEHVGLRVTLIIVTLTSWLSSSQGLLSQGAGLTARANLARNLCYNDMHCRLETLRQNSRATKAEWFRSEDKREREREREKQLIYGFGAIFGAGVLQTQLPARRNSRLGLYQSNGIASTR